MGKPDNVADDPGLLPYGSNIGAPSIKIDDVGGWKQINLTKVNKHFVTRFNELKTEYDKLVDEFNWNEMVYSSKYSFEPIIGERYHLYYNKDKDVFLSIINPNEWKYEYIGTFVMDTNNKWIKIN